MFWRFYVYGLLLLVLAVAATAVAGWLLGSRYPLRHNARQIALRMARDLGPGAPDPARLQRRAEDLHQLAHVDVAAYDAAGRRTAAAGEDAPGPLTAPERVALEQGTPFHRGTRILVATPLEGGGYLLLVLGVYVPVLSAIDALKEALKASDLGSASDSIVGVVLPVGIGVAIGILVISNLIKVVLERFEQPTLGALMGLLVGAVFGLWPFQEGVAPKIGEVFKGQALTAERLAELTPDKYPTEFYAPTFTDVMMAIGLVGVGYMITTLIARVGGAKPSGHHA